MLFTACKLRCLMPLRLFDHPSDRPVQSFLNGCLSSAWQRPDKGCRLRIWMTPTRVRSDRADARSGYAGYQSSTWVTVRAERASTRATPMPAIQA